MKKTLLGVALAPVLAWVVGGVAIAAPAAFKGDDGNFYVTGLSSNLVYQVSADGVTVKAAANGCGMVRILPSRLAVGNSASVKDPSGQVIVSSTNLNTQKPPLCKNGYTYNPVTSGYWIWLGYEDNVLYAGKYYNADRDIPLIVENPSLQQERIFTASACGVVQIKTNNPNFPIDSSDTIADENGSYTVASLTVSDTKPKCKDGLFSNNPADRFLATNNDGSQTLYLAGYRASQKVVVRNTSKPKRIKVKTNSCGVVQAKGLGFSPGGKVRLYWPDGNLSGWHDSVGRYRKPICQNGVFYIPW
jgi:hypothetical protein